MIYNFCFSFVCQWPWLLPPNPHNHIIQLQILNKIFCLSLNCIVDEKLGIYVKDMLMCAWVYVIFFCEYDGIAYE